MPKSLCFSLIVIKVFPLYVVKRLNNKRLTSSLCEYVYFENGNHIRDNRRAHDQLTETLTKQVSTGGGSKNHR